MVKNTVLIQDRYGSICPISSSMGWYDKYGLLVLAFVLVLILCQNGTIPYQPMTFKLVLNNDL